MSRQLTLAFSPTKTTKAVPPTPSTNSSSNSARVVVTEERQELGLSLEAPLPLSTSSSHTRNFSTPSAWNHHQHSSRSSNNKMPPKKTTSSKAAAAAGAGGKESTINADLSTLGLPSLEDLEGRLQQAREKKLGGVVKGHGKPQDQQKDDDKSKEQEGDEDGVPDSERDPTNDISAGGDDSALSKTSSKEGRGGVAPTESDVHPQSGDHERAAKDAQDEADKTPGAGARGKKRSKPDDADEGGVAGARGGQQENGSDGKKKQRTVNGAKKGGEEAGSGREAYQIHGKVAHADNAARVDAHPPLDELMQVQDELFGKKKAKSKPKSGGGSKSVVYWMRMEDVRVVDNRALHLASSRAAAEKLPLIVLFTAVPGDWRAHDRGTRKIDFILRNLKYVEAKLHELDIPLKFVEHTGNRRKLPERIVDEILPELGAAELFANIEHEVDELRRDIAVCHAAAKSGLTATFVHDRLAVPPGKLKTGKGTPFAVYSPWQRQWAAYLAANPESLEEFPSPEANPASTRKDLASLFESSVPDEITGFECVDRDVMEKIWPVGDEAAIKILGHFLDAPSSKRYLGLVSPLTFGEEKKQEAILSRIQNYADGRNSADTNTSSRMSPYLAAGVISARMVLNKARSKCKNGKLESGRDTGVGMWVQEVAWRDFYNHVLAAFPRVSMGRPYIEKLADVQWETSEAHLNAWKEGKTGYPIVDAAMRQCKYQGWMHNRPRMICASFLVKDLMLDWRLGERHFMESFIDGDLAANNGGWQWCASTGTDPQPYFRIFNPTSQSETASPDGSYIRYWLPELAGLKGKAIHDPYGSLSPAEFKKLGYPKPIVDHKKSRERALARYKNPGERPDEA